MSHLGRWHITQAIFQQFWEQWSQEYITQLQQQGKWFKGQENLSVNNLILNKDETMTLLKWKLGRKVDVHARIDQKVRVVTVHTDKGTVKRSIIKLCPLAKKTYKC